jgi:hypothetical protein
MSPENKQHHVGIEQIISRVKEMALMDRHAPFVIAANNWSLLAGQIGEWPNAYEKRVQLMQSLGQSAAESGQLRGLQWVFFASAGWIGKETLIVLGLQVQELRKYIAVYEMVRNEDDQPIDLAEILPLQEKDMSLETPFLDAFVEGFHLAF